MVRAREMHRNQVYTWLEMREGVRMIKISYDALIARPEAEALRVCRSRFRDRLSIRRTFETEPRYGRLAQMPLPASAKILLIGWDAADWKLIHPLMDSGLMPTLNAFVDSGVIGNLATLQPMISPMLWNSIATGMRPEKHGILGFIEPNIETGRVRPVSSLSRKVKAVWNILTQEGLRTHVIGWFAGHPAEPVNGVSVSDLYPLVQAPHGEPWPLPPGTVHPERLRETMAGLRMHGGDIKPAAILPFIPEAARIDQTVDKRLAMFAKVLAETCSIHNAATWTLEHEPWDFAAVYYTGIDHFCHGFMNFHPPQLPGIADDLFALYKGVVDGAYRFHDMMLARLLQMVPADTTVILVSDHGFRSGHLRPAEIPDEPAGPTVQHREFGVIAMRGPSIKRDERIYGATILDIAPTILSIYGLPVGEDMDGRVLVDAFPEPPHIARIPSWEQVPGPSGMHPAGLRVDSESSRALIEQFAALGYIQQQSSDAEAVAVAARELKFNLARTRIDARDPLLAIPLLEQLAEERPAETRFRQHLAHCYLLTRRTKKARETLEKIRGESPREGTSQALNDWLMGLVLKDEGSLESALQSLRRAEEAQMQLPSLHIRLGLTYLSLSRIQDASRAFEKALAIDDESPEALVGLARVRLLEKRNEEAAEHALTAVGLQHFYPIGHFYLGVALTRLNEPERAIVAFETAVAMAPGMAEAHRRLGTLHRKLDKNSPKARLHLEAARAIRVQVRD
jgi:tetratricopeptide (TPR) repeat protein